MTEKSTWRSLSNWNFELELNVMKVIWERGSLLQLLRGILVVLCRRRKVPQLEEWRK
jgi:hypothetical protein